MTTAISCVTRQLVPDAYDQRVFALREVHQVVRQTRTALAPASGRRLGDAAAESAFFLALAILPMMLTTTGVLRALRPVLGHDARPGVERGLARLLRVVLTSRGGTAAEAAESLLANTNGGLLTLGTVASLFVVTRAMRSLLTGLHTLHSTEFRGSKRQLRRRWIHAFGLGAVGVALAAVLLAMIVVGPLLGHVEEVLPGRSADLRDVWLVVRWPVATAVAFCYFVLLHSIGLCELDGSRVVRSRRPGSWRAATAGASVSTVASVAATFLLPLYVHLASKVSPTLGVLGGGLILLVWAYLIAYGIVLGGQVRARLIRPRISGAP